MIVSLKLFICADYSGKTKQKKIKKIKKKSIKSEVNLSQETSNTESLDLAKVAV